MDIKPVIGEPLSQMVFGDTALGGASKESRLRGQFVGEGVGGEDGLRKREGSSHFPLLPSALSGEFGDCFVGFRDTTSCREKEL